MEKKNTAVDALYYWLCINREATGDQWFKAYMEAKEMEKEQIIEFGREVADHWGMTEVPKEYIEQYYNETYGKETDRS